ncbi:hypothetical protein KSS87_022734 [Heliosperma pusillum]|nr:hypothetical protein KSS87_022734 [Heliosperma pusillum]
MEYFANAKCIRLRSHHNKYLTAGKDSESVKQSRDGNTIEARWNVELVQNKPNIIRLRSCHNKLLTASEEPFLLGWTGKKAVQTIREDVSVEWEPIMESGGYVKLRAAVSGKYLRGNFRAPPWRNSVTVDLPEITATKDWIMWVVDEDVGDGLDDRCVWVKNGRALTQGRRIRRIGFRSSTDVARCSVSSSSTEATEEEVAELVALTSIDSFSSLDRVYKGGLELFRNARTVRLRSQHGKYLIADDNEESVIQARKGESRRARWSVEYVKSVEGLELVRLKSCYDKYLTATDDEFLLGMTGKKVKQTTPKSPNSSIEWEPIREGMEIKFKTRYGNFLRANGGLPPWRNSITHDVPNSSHTQDWILWEVDVLQLYPKVEEIEEIEEIEEDEDASGSKRFGSEVDLPSFHHSFKSKTGELGVDVKHRGRVIRYNIVIHDGSIEDADEGRSLVFTGNGVTELRQCLEQVTGFSGITLCTRSPLDGKLYPMRLALPPNHVPMKREFNVDTQTNMRRHEMKPRNWSPGKDDIR